MEITGINVRKLFDGGKMRAVCSVTFDNSLAVHDIKVIETEEKRFIAMPSRKTRLGEFSDVVHPITQSFRAKLEQAVIQAYLAASEEEKENIT